MGLLKNGLNDGHIPRNMRLSLRLIELLLPEVWFGSDTMFYGIGCFNMTAALVTAPSCTELDTKGTVVTDFGSRPCLGLGLWERIQEEEVKGGEINFERPQGVKGCLAIRASFDVSWAHQNHPDPDVKPRTHLVESRTLDRYTTEGGDSRIDARRLRFFEVPIPSKGASSAGGAVAGAATTLPTISSKPTVVSQPGFVPKKSPPAVDAGGMAEKKEEESLVEETQTSALDPRPLLRSDRVFALWLIVVIILGLCLLWQSRKRLYEGPDDLLDEIELIEEEPI